jgi:hypothetical protein
MHMTTKTIKTSSKNTKNVVVKGTKKQNAEMPCNPFFGC